MKRFFWLALLFFPLVAGAQKRLLERVYEGQSSQKNPVIARQEIMADATDKISEDVIKEIIGEAKFTRNKALIKSKIMKSAPLYLPFSKASDPEPIEPEGFKMTITMKVNVDDLQALLLENGLFYESDSTPMVLPTIRWEDKVNSKNYAWWTGSDVASKPFLSKEARNLESDLKDSFLKHNFYLLKAESFHFSEILPSSLKAESLRPEDWQLISQRLGAQILVDGQVVISKSQERSEAFSISLKMTATQVMNSRVIAEVSRQFETDIGPFEQVVDRKLKDVMETASQDLATQVLDAWQKGTLGAALFKLTINGRLPILQQEAFKEALKNKVREVKDVRERLISSDQVVYEVDSAIGPKELSQKASEIQVGGLKMVLESATDKEAIYRLAR